MTSTKLEHKQDNFKPGSLSHASGTLASLYQSAGHAEIVASNLNGPSPITVDEALIAMKAVMDVDISRAKAFVLNDSLEVFKSELKSQTYGAAAGEDLNGKPCDLQNPDRVYVQGSWDGRAGFLILQTALLEKINNNTLKLSNLKTDLPDADESDIEGRFKSLGFAYTYKEPGDDKDHFGAFCIAYADEVDDNGQPKQRHMIVTVCHDITKGPYQKVDYWTSSGLFPSPETSAQNNQISEVESNHLALEVANAVGSEKVAQLLTGVFSATNLNERTFNELQERFKKGYNIDDRENRVTWFSQYMDDVKNIIIHAPKDVQKAILSQLQQYATSAKNDINFYQSEMLIKHLSDMIKEVKEVLAEDDVSSKEIKTEQTLKLDILENLAKYQLTSPEYAIEINKVREILRNASPYANQHFETINSLLQKNNLPSELNEQLKTLVEMSKDFKKHCSEAYVQGLIHITKLSDKIQEQFTESLEKDGPLEEENNDEFISRLKAINSALLELVPEGQKNAVEKRMQFLVQLTELKLNNNTPGASKVVQQMEGKFIFSSWTSQTESIPSFEELENLVKKMNLDIDVGGYKRAIQREFTSPGAQINSVGMPGGLAVHFKHNINELVALVIRSRALHDDIDSQIKLDEMLKKCVSLITSPYSVEEANDFQEFIDTNVDLLSKINPSIFIEATQIIKQLELMRAIKALSNEAVRKRDIPNCFKVVNQLINSIQTVVSENLNADQSGFIHLLEASKKILAAPTQQDVDELREIREYYSTSTNPKLNEIATHLNELEVLSRTIAPHSLDRIEQKNKEIQIKLKSIRPISQEQSFISTHLLHLTAQIETRVFELRKQGDLLSTEAHAELKIYDQFLNHDVSSLNLPEQMCTNIQHLQASPLLSKDFKKELAMLSQTSMERIGTIEGRRKELENLNEIITTKGVRSQALVISKAKYALLVFAEEAKGSLARMKHTKSESILSKIRRNEIRAYDSAERILALGAQFIQSPDQNSIKALQTLMKDEFVVMPPHLRTELDKAVSAFDYMLTVESLNKLTEKFRGFKQHDLAYCIQGFVNSVQTVVGNDPMLYDVGWLKKHNDILNVCKSFLDEVSKEPLPDARKIIKLFNQICDKENEYLTHAKPQLQRCGGWLAAIAGVGLIIAGGVLFGVGLLGFGYSLALTAIGGALIKAGINTVMQTEQHVNDQAKIKTHFTSFKKQAETIKNIAEMVENIKKPQDNNSQTHDNNDTPSPGNH